jgi:drug/metabolite transporter (DMT)-like permease
MVFIRLSDLAQIKVKTMNYSTSNSKWLVVLAFAAIYVIWGSTYLAILFAIGDIPPFLMSGLRFLAAGIILYLWRTWKGEKQPDFTSFGKNVICGILMLVGGTVSVAWAEQYLSSSLAAIIVTAVPFWFILLDKQQWSSYFSNKIIVTGLVLGFAGVAVLVAFTKSEHVYFQNTGKQWLGALALIVGSIAWTSGSLFSKYKPAKSSMLMSASIQLLAAGLFCMMASIFSGEAKNFSFVNVNTTAWLALIYLVVMGSLVAYLSYLWLLKIRPLAIVSTYVYINPVVAMLLGALIAGEKITTLQMAALLIILTGVLMVNKARFSSSGKFTFREMKKYDQHCA